GAVAASAVLAVTQPNMCGVGGDIFVLYYEAATRRVHFLNGAGRSGTRASLEELRRRGASALPIVGPMTVSVPGCVRGWAMLLERFGTRPLAALLEPAIQYAEGFPTSSLTSQSIDEFAGITADAEWHRVFRPGDRAPALGEPLVQSDLARTLRDLGAEGPDLFYTGRVARAMAERLARDGFLTPDDLAEHTGEWGEAIATTYRGLRVYETPPAIPRVTRPASSSSIARATWPASSRACSTRSARASSCPDAASSYRTAAATSSSIPRIPARSVRASGRFTR